MRTGRLLWVAALLLVAAGLAGADDEAPAVLLGPTQMVMDYGEQSLRVALVNSVITVRTPSGAVTLTPCIQSGKSFVQPGQVADTKAIRGVNRITMQLVFPVGEDREFVVSVEAWRNIPVYIVTSQLKVLERTAPQYYYWQTTLSGEKYTAPTANGSEEIAFRTAEWDVLPWRDWWLLSGDKGKIALFPTNCGGRVPDPEGDIFLHALPRSAVVCPGASLDAQFGIGAVADAREATALCARLHGESLPVLAPWQEEVPQFAYGKAAPDWLRGAETYNLFYHPAAEWTDEAVARLKPFPFVIGSTPDAKALERCHAQGLKLLHYVTYTCLLDTALQTQEGGKVYSEWSESLDSASRDLKDHPDWVCLDANGKPQHDAWGQAHGHPGLLNTCLHQAGLQDAAVRQVQKLMAMGYDGIFIDLAGPTPECYGPKFGKHTHPDGAGTNTQAWERLMGRLYTTVKEFGDDRVVIQNTCTSFLPKQWATCDAQMLEAFPYGADGAALRPTWPEILLSAARQRAAVKAGKVPLLLSYLGKQSAASAREATQLSLAVARYAGFLWADALELGQLPGQETLAQAVYATRLGQAVGEPHELGRIVYREFTGGVAVLNPLPWAVSLSLPVAPGTYCLVGDTAENPAPGGLLKLDLPASSGRVLVRK